MQIRELSRLLEIPIATGNFYRRQLGIESSELTEEEIVNICAMHMRTRIRRSIDKVRREIKYERRV